jgi:hypothetical protein
MEKWKRLGKGIYLVLAIGMSVLVVRANLCLWMISASSYVPGQVSEDVLWQLHNIKQRLSVGEGERMQTLFPEGWFFSHIIYGNSWVNVALSTNVSKRSKRFVGFCPKPIVPKDLLLLRAILKFVMACFI